MTMATRLGSSLLQDIITWRTDDTATGGTVNLSETKTVQETFLTHVLGLPILCCCQPRHVPDIKRVLLDAPAWPALPWLHSATKPIRLKLWLATAPYDEHDWEVLASLLATLHDNG
jgi:hypothetical protein